MIFNKKPTPPTRLFLTEFQNGKLGLVTLVRPPFVVPTWMRAAYALVFGIVVIQNWMSRVQASVSSTEVPGNV